MRHDHHRRVPRQVVDAVIAVFILPPRVVVAFGLEAFQPKRVIPDLVDGDHDAPGHLGLVGIFSFVRIQTIPNHGNPGRRLVHRGHKLRRPHKADPFIQIGAFQS